MASSELVIFRNVMSFCSRYLNPSEAPPSAVQHDELEHGTHINHELVKQLNNPNSHLTYCADSDEGLHPGQGNPCPAHSMFFVC